MLQNCKEGKKSLKEGTFIAGFMELEFSLPCTSIEEQTGRFRQRGYSFVSKVTYVKVYVIFLRENEASILASTGDMCRAYSEVNLKLDCTRFST